MQTFSVRCFQNYASEILEANKLNLIYGWKRHEKTGKNFLERKKNLGISGNCLHPEIDVGMRNCWKNSIPVVRNTIKLPIVDPMVWRIFSNSVDLAEIEKLL